MSEMDLLTKEVTIRGKLYVVSELDARTMADGRTLLSSDQSKAKFESLVAQRCCVSPKLTEADIAKLPHFVVEKLSETATQLSKSDGSEKND